MEQLKQATGVDVAQIAGQLSAEKPKANGVVNAEKPLIDLKQL